MNVYFTAASTYVISKRANIYTKILSEIRNFGHQQTNYFFLAKNNPTKTKTQNLLDARTENVYSVSTDFMLNSDCVIAEITTPSITIGSQIEMALNHKIPVLCLFESSRKSVIPLFIRDNPSNLMTRRVYTENDIKQNLQDFFDSFRKGKIRYNLFLNYNIDKYLEFTSKRKNIPKSEIFRGIIEERMKKDKSFSDTLSCSNNFKKYRNIPYKKVSI